MSLGTVLTLIFLLVFIVLPLFSRASRQSSRQRPDGLPPTPPREPQDVAEADAPPWLAEAQRRVREARAEVSAEASTGAPSGHPLAPGELFTEPEPSPRGRALVPEDARGRPLAPPRGPLVRGDPFEQTMAPPEQGQLVPDDPFGRGLAGRGSQAGQVGAGPQGAPATGQAAAPPPPAQPAGMPTREPRMGPEAAGVAVEADKGRSVEVSEQVWITPEAHMRRRRARGGARVGAMDLQRFGGRDIVSGLIWHEILDEPAWKRRQRRASSRPRSR